MTVVSLGCLNETRYVHETCFPPKSVVRSTICIVGMQAGAQWVGTVAFMQMFMVQFSVCMY